MQAVKLVDTSELSRSEWLEVRRQGIGGSDVGAILGINPYKSPVQVYREKIGEVGEQEDNEAMEHGRDLEGYIRIKFQQRTGKKVTKMPFVYQHPTHPFLLANIDGWVVDENAGLECKNVSEWRRNEWENNQVPNEYKLQCNHYMSVMGADRWYVCAFIGGNKIEIREIERDQELIDTIEQRLEEFWTNHVLAKTPPAFMAQDTDYVNGLYRVSVPRSTITLPSELKAHITKARAYKQQIDEAKRIYEEVRNQLKGEAQENELIYIDGELVATWKMDKNGKRTFKFIGGEE